jgi:O-antigen/teichoic acid export membrane protein
LAYETTIATGSDARDLTVRISWNVLAFAIVLASNVLTVPIVLRSIGLSALGHAGLVFSMCSLMMLIGTVIGQAVVARGSYQIGTGDPAGGIDTVTAGLRLCLIACPIAWLLLVGLGPVVTARFSAVIPGDSLAPSFVICCTGLLLRQISIVLQSVCAMRQNFKRLAQVAAVSALIDIKCIILMTHFVPTTNGYLLGVALSSLVSLGVWIRVMWPDIFPVAVLTQALAAEVRGLLRFSAWQGAAGVSVIVAVAIDPIMLGAVAPATALGHYNIAARLQQAASVGFSSCSDVLLPYIARQLAGRGGLVQPFQRISWVIGSFGAVLFAPLIPLAEPLLVLWVGKEVADGSAFLLRALVVWGLLGTTTSVFAHYAMGGGQVDKLSKITLVYALTTIILSPVFVICFGIHGAGLGLVAAGILRSVSELATVRRHFFRDLALRDGLVTTVLPKGVGLAVGFGLVALQTPDYRFANITTVIELAAAFAAVAGLTGVMILIASLLTRCGRTVMGALLTTLRHEVRLLMAARAAKQIG